MSCGSQAFSIEGCRQRADKGRQEGSPMQLKSRLSFAIAALLTAAPTILVSAQQAPVSPKRHLRYRLVDLGTFGGLFSKAPFSPRALTRSGVVVGYAETDIPDPFAPNCNPDCLVQQAFVWRHGVLTRLVGFSPNMESGAQAVNEDGVVVGESQNGLVDPVSGAPTIHGVLWKRGHLVDLGTLGGASSGALSTNNRSQVVGWSETSIPDPASGFAQVHAFLWERGVMRDLGTLGGPFSFGVDVNDRGQAGGFSLTAPDPQTGQSAQHAFVWDRGRLVDLSLGGSFAEGATLNNRGQAVGHSRTAGDVEDHAFLWDGSRTIDLGTLGGTFSLPTGLSERGHVSGVATTTNDELLHAVLWRRRKAVDLGTVPGDGCSWAWDLNARDQVVGISLPFPCDFSVAHAFLWEHGEMVDLNTLVSPPSDFTLVYATGINEAGEIVGNGVPAGVSPADWETLGHAFVLVPIHDEANDTSASAAPVNAGEPAASAAPADARTITKEVLARIQALRRR
jgi:probable HAF family extracellular repeat protein